MRKVYAIGIFYARAFFILERGLGKTAYSSAKRANLNFTRFAGFRLIAFIASQPASGGPFQSGLGSFFSQHLLRKCSPASAYNRFPACQKAHLQRNSVAAMSAALESVADMGSSGTVLTILSALIPLPFFALGLRVGAMAHLRNVLQPVQQGGQEGLSAVCRGIQIIRNQYFPSRQTYKRDCLPESQFFHCVSFKEQLRLLFSVFAG